MQPHSMRIRLAEDLDGLPEDFMIECCESEGIPLRIFRAIVPHSSAIPCLLPIRLQPNEIH